jgi:hypothetical protein
VLITDGQPNDAPNSPSIVRVIGEPPLVLPCPPDIATDANGTFT